MYLRDTSILPVYPLRNDCYININFNGFLNRSSLSNEPG